MDAIDALHQTLQRLPGDCKPVLGDAAITFATMPLRITVAEIDVNDKGAVVVYDVSGLEAKPDREGIRVLARGHGSDARKALGDAAFIWATGVFTVVQHWIRPAAHTCFADDSHMLVRSADPAEEFGWRVHQGPILSREYGRSGTPEVDPMEIYETLFNQIHPYAAHRTVFWIEAFAIRYQNGEVDATCRFRNKDWDEGKEELLLYASSWELPEGMTLSRRQFFLFEPIVPAAIPERRKLEKKLDELDGAKKPWWKRLF